MRIFLMLIKQATEMKENIQFSFSMKAQYLYQTPKNSK